MTQARERYQAVADLFARVRLLPPDRREAELVRACGPDLEQLREVREMLAAAEDPANPLKEERIVAERRRLEREFLPDPSGERMPARIGPYEVVRRLGRGGMGVVYEAEQPNPRRRVAVKLLHASHVHGEYLRRFRLEAEVLGRLQHPGIAQIHAAGTFDSPDGERPYIAMELVSGVSLLAHAQRESLDRQARLELVARICDAVQHAHDHGVLHRDLKPDNILVDGHGQPKVLDFGVARAADTGPELSTIHTAQGALVGTVTHMAPEQLGGHSEAIGAATDVYALGVIAFELLSGRLPHEVAGLSVTAAVRLVCEHSAPRLGRIDRSLRGDVEIVVAKALELEPARRYVSPAALAADLRRLVAQQPITARRPSPLYRAAKFTRRHRAFVAASTLAVAALVGGTLLSLDQARRATAGEELANGRAREAEHQAYRATVAAVAAAIDGRQFQAAREELTHAPVAAWSWEAEHLAAVLDGAFGTSLYDGPARGALLAADGTTAYTGHLDGRSGELLRFSLPEGALVARYALDARPLRVPHEALEIALSLLVELHPEGFALDVVDSEGAERDGAAVFHARIGAHAPRDSSMPVLHFQFARERGLALLPDARGVRICQLSTGNTVGPFGGGAMSYALSANGALVLEGGNTVALAREPLSGDEVWRTPESTDGMTSATLSPDGRFAYTVGLIRDPMLRKWRIGDATPLAERRLEGCSGSESWAVAPDGEAVAVAPTHRWVSLFDGDLERELARCELLRCDSVDLALGARGARLLAAMGFAGLRTWDLTRPPARSVLRGHDTYVYSVAFSPDGRRLASGAFDGRVRTWSVDTATAVDVFAPWEAGHVSRLEWSADGRVLFAAAGTDLRALDAGTGRELARARADSEVLALARRPGASELLLATKDEVRILDPVSLDVLRTFTGQGGAWSPDGTAVVTGGGESWLVLHDAETLAERWRVGAPAALKGLAFSPDGLRIAALQDERLFVLEAGDGTLRLEIEAAGMMCGIWSPDSRRLVTGHGDGVLSTWDAETGDHIMDLKDHHAYVISVAFSPDGFTLASASGDGDVRLWRARAHAAGD